MEARGRRATGARHRRRRLTAALGGTALLAGAVAAIVALGSGGGSTSGVTSSSASTPTTRTRPVAAMSPSLLPAPVSGEAVVADGGGLLVIGGLDIGGASTDGVLRLDQQASHPQQAGTLSKPLHDLAAATLGSGVTVFGGGATTSTSAVESLGSGDQASIIGRLPAPRSDLAAVTVGDRAYVLGGYDGTTLSRDVLATADGRTFSKVAKLPVPVRYPAVAVTGSTIYAFGGETAAGRATDVIQAVDTATGEARVAGHLPGALDHASAVALGGTIYVLGGSVHGSATDRILAFDPAHARAAGAGRLPMPVANAAAATVGDTAYLVGGIDQMGSSLASIVTVSLKPVGGGADPAASSPAPFSGQLMIADRGNDRLLAVNASKRIVWRYPAPGRPAPPGGFYFPDDVFFTHGGTGLIINQEENETIVQLAYPSGKVTWQYGHPGVTGTTAGYLHEPDDAYLLPDGTITVADAQNCRVLLIDSHDRSTSQIGATGGCVHNPPHALGSPNGDTPLANGNILVSEVNGSWIDELTTSGKLVWTTHLPIAYPSDPQQLGPDRYLVADYSRPGGIYEFDRAGHILWSYHPTSGNAMLDHPSLAVRLPNGLIAANDDYRHRVVIIDPRTKRIVWQYGQTDHPGTGTGFLNTPDGIDLLDPSGTTPTHPYTG